MADMLFTGLFLISVHLVVSQDAEKCGSPLVYEDKRLVERYATRQEFNDGDLVRYKCILGYTPEAGSRRESYCRGGQWTHLDLHCVKSRTMQCNNGRWTPSDIRCKKKSCGAAEEIVNGAFLYTGISFGDTATAVCKEGHLLVGSGVIQCRAEGWYGRMPLCEAVQCPEPPKVPGAEVNLRSAEKIKYHQVASYRCLTGKLIGNSDIYCTKHGNWSKTAFHCQEPCPNPEVMAGMMVSGYSSRYLAGNVVSMRCNTEWNLVGSGVITCGEDGFWKPGLPKCVKI